ncbi:MAG TPA: winged helix DNA-binding domain-containing protein [Gaiellaceae bacterium]|nr:winged helix DNA-binding domain-containing protein [Gaiellaceae bacterium]
MTERVLSQRELNRATLARQLLLKRAKLPVVQAVERVAGLQAQLGSTPYIGLWTRLEDFRPQALDRALLGGKVSRGLLMRGTVHLVSTRDFALFATALEVTAPAWVTPEVEEIAHRVAPSLRAFTAEPRTRAEIFDWLEHEHGIVSDGTNRLWYAMRIRGRIGHSAAASLWQAPVHGPTFIAVEQGDHDGALARAELVRRYLAAFGPATRAEIAGWSGLKVRDFADGLDGLVAFRDDRGRELLDLPRAPRPGADTPAPVRLLPKFDNVLLDRQRVLPEAYRKLVVRKNADVQPTFTVDGYVAGVWRVEKGRVLTEAFAPLPLEARRELQDEAERLQAWLG